MGQPFHVIQKYNFYTKYNLYTKYYTHFPNTVKSCETNQKNQNWHVINIKLH